MEAHFLKYLPPFLLSMWKFVGGPLAGLAANLSVLEITLLTSAGMMTTVVALTYAGERFRSYFTTSGRSRKEKKTNSRVLKVWNKYGVPGVAFLTPLILTPIVGTLILVANKAQKKEIIVYMAISAILWAFVQTVFFKYFYEQIMGWI